MVTATTTTAPPRTGRFGELIPAFGFSRRPAGRLTDCSAWQSHDGLVVLSALELAQLPGSTHDTGLHWHLSASRSTNRSNRPTDFDLGRVCAAFGVPDGYEEDNHHPGFARHIWCPVDPAFRGICECKVTETTVVEADGYTWTNPTDGDNS